MTDTPHNRGPKSFFSADADRLESWKEIAAYLKRDIRTVQRWEKRESLPVHRHLHDKLGTVYAYKSELDSWWAERGAPEEKSPGHMPADVAEPAGRSSRFAPLILAALGMVPVVVFTSWFMQRDSARTRTEQPVFQRATQIEGTVGRVSPDGQWLAYFDAARGELLLQRLRTREVKSLSRGGGGGPVAWSRDSQRIAFLTRREGGDGAQYELRVTRVASGESQVWWRGIVANLLEPQDWIDDRRLLGRARSRGGSQIVLLAEGQASPEVLANVTGEVGVAQASPDGRFLAYSASRENNREIYIRRLKAGSEETRITDSPSQDGFPTWSPDGRLLIFVRQRGSASALWAARIAPETGARTEEIFLRTIPARNRLISITRQGQIHFAHRVRNSRVFLLNVDAQTGEISGPPHSSFDDETYDPAWVRRGGLSYRRTLPDSSTVFALRNVEADSQNEYRLPRSHTVTFLAHTQDGKHFTFFGTDPSGRSGFFEYYPEADEVLTLHLTDEDVRPPARWSPDRMELMYSAAPLADGRHPVRILNRRSGRVRTRALSSSQPFAKWSPDGSQIAFSDGNCLKTMPRESGASRVVVCNESARAGLGTAPAAGGIGWSPDGTKLAWATHHFGERRAELWIVDALTARRSVWRGDSDFASWPVEPAWSPNPSQLAFRMEYKPQFEVWSLENVLPRE